MLRALPQSCGTNLFFGPKLKIGVAASPMRPAFYRRAMRPRRHSTAVKHCIGCLLPTPRGPPWPSPIGRYRPRAEWQPSSHRTGNLPFVPAKPFGRFRANRSLAQSRRPLRSRRVGNGAARATTAVQVFRANITYIPDLVHGPAPAAGCPAADRLALYCAVMPPSITSSEPVTQDDSSDARNSTPLAMSSAVPSRPIGVRSSSTWRAAGSLKRFSVSGVSA